MVGLWGRGWGARVFGDVVVGLKMGGRGRGGEWAGVWEREQGFWGEWMEARDPVRIWGAGV